MRPACPIFPLTCWPCKSEPDAAYMAATVRIYGKRCTVALRVEDPPWLWTCPESRNLEIELQRSHINEEWRERWGPAMANAALELAEMMVAEYGGELISFDEVESRPGVVY